MSCKFTGMCFPGVMDAHASSMLIKNPSRCRGDLHVFASYILITVHCSNKWARFSSNAQNEVCTYWMSSICIAAGAKLSSHHVNHCALWIQLPVCLCINISQWFPTRGTCNIILQLPGGTWREWRVAQLIWTNLIYDLIEVHPHI